MTAAGAAIAPMLLVPTVMACLDDRMELRFRAEVSPQPPAEVGRLFVSGAGDRANGGLAIR